SFRCRSVQAAVARFRLEDQKSVFPRGLIAPLLFGLVPKVFQGHLSPLQFTVERAVGLVKVANEVQNAPRLEVLGPVADSIEESGNHDVFAGGSIQSHLDLTTIARPVLGFLVSERLMQGPPER